MKALAIIGYISLLIGIAIAFANPLLNQSSITIYCSGRIEYPNKESESTESSSQTIVDSTVYIPIIIGVGLLSIAFLGGTVKKNCK